MRVFVLAGFGWRGFGYSSRIAGDTVRSLVQFRKVLNGLEQTLGFASKELDDADAHKAAAFIRELEAAPDGEAILDVIDDALGDDPCAESRIEATLDAEFRLATAGAASSSSCPPVSVAVGLPRRARTELRRPTPSELALSWSEALVTSATALEFGRRAWLQDPRDGIVSLVLLNTKGRPAASHVERGICEARVWVPVLGWGWVGLASLSQFLFSLFAWSGT